MNVSLILSCYDKQCKCHLNVLALVASGFLTSATDAVSLFSGAKNTHRVKGYIYIYKGRRQEKQQTSKPKQETKGHT